MGTGNDLKAWIGTGFGLLADEEDFEKLNQANQEEAILEELKNEDREAAWRFQEQCFLMLNWEGFSKANPKSYKNFCQIEHPTPFEYNNLLFKKTENAELLLQLNAAQLSALVPQVRIYKEYVDPNNKRSYSLELPFDDVTRRDKIEHIRQTAVGRGGGVGLKSFTWKTLGTNPANKYTFGAQMVLHFQNIEEFFEIRNVRNVLMGGNSQDIQLSYSDLLLPQRKFREGANEGSFTYNRDYFRVKVVCGWHSPKDMGVRLFSKEVLDVLDQTKTVMYLGLKDHQFDFRDDGTVELTINYIAYSDSLMTDPQESNILFPSPEVVARRKALAKTIDRLENNLKRRKEELGRNGLKGDEEVDSESNAPPSKPAVSPTQFVAILEQQIEQNKEELEKVNAVSKELSYQRIIENLLLSGRIYPAAVDVDFFQKQLRVRSTSKKKTTLEEANLANQQTANANRQAKSSGRRTDVLDIDALNKIAISDYENGGIRRTLNLEDTTTAEESLANQGKAFKDSTKITKEDIVNGQQIVQFFKFGDLLEVVLDGMFNVKGAPPRANFEQKELKILLGNLTFYDYGQLVDTGLVMKTKGVKNEKYGYDKIYTGKRVSVNMADIPISLKVFTAWFVENVTDKGLEHMSFKTFVDKVVNDLIIRAVSTECREFAPRQQARITYKSFSVPANSKRSDLFKKSLEMNRGYRVLLNELKGAEFKLSPSKTDQQGENPMENYVLIYGTVEAPFDLKGEPDQDKKKGIYHLFFGNEVGLVKRIGFQREDLPYVREANIQNNLTDKKGPAKILRDKYNANVEMVGNNIFEVGGKVHITPSVFGSGAIIDRSKVLKDLGIGGYFDIISVENVIEPGRFDTILETKWTARGDGTFNIGDEEISTTDVRDVRIKLNQKTARVLG